MNKTELLFQMMEHPREYSEEQWQDVLADDECRELYNLMSKTQSAFDMQKDVTDEEMDAEWQRIEDGKRNFSLFALHSPLTKVAAMFVGILMISGITVAAIWNLTSSPSPGGKGRDHTQVEDTVVRESAPHTPGKEDQRETYCFDNVSLDRIVSTIADYYHKEAEVKNDQASRLRFYFVWRQTDSLQTVVEQLNQFERVNIEVENDKLIVR